MKRETAFFLGVFLAAFVGVTALIVHNRSPSTHSEPLGSLPRPQSGATVPSVLSPVAIRTDDGRNAAWAVTKLSEEIKGLQEPVERLSLRVRNPLATIEGCFILAEDKQYLGKITWNEFDSESILNEFGRYGGRFSSTSIFNDFGTYGGEIALYSPFNSIAVNPPKIFTRDGDFVAYLTVNKLKAPRIDPHVLVAFLKSR
jgi:hypothetical protein